MDVRALHFIPSRQVNKISLCFSQINNSQKVDTFITLTKSRVDPKGFYFKANNLVLKICIIHNYTYSKILNMSTTMIPRVTYIDKISNLIH